MCIVANELKLKYSLEPMAVAGSEPAVQPNKFLWDLRLDYHFALELKNKKMFYLKKNNSIEFRI